MTKSFTEREIRQMELSIIERMKYIKEKQNEIIEFKKYYRLINKFVSSLSNEEYIEQFDLLSKIEDKLNSFYVDMSPFEFDSSEFSRLKYLIRQILSIFNKTELLNPIIIKNLHFQLIDSYL